MAEVVDNSLSRLTSGDIAAMVAYLKTVPAIRSPNLPPVDQRPASDAREATTVSIDVRGRQIFEGACASCHGWSGVSPLASSANLPGDRAINDPTGINVARIVLGGQPRPGSLTSMPSFADAYSDSEIAAVANYVTARFGAAPSRIAAADVARLRRSSAD